jgi:hypothetical protein
MSAQIAGAASRFSDRVLRFLERVEHRVARTPAEKEAVYRLRYEAYIRNGLVEPRADGRLYDERYDEAPDAWITTTFIDGELAATTRVNLGADEDAILPAFAVYPDVIAPYLRAGRVIVESTRTAARLDLAGRFPELPYITLRPAYLASQHFDADFVVATTRAEHMAFFRRVFRFEPWSEPRDYPNFKAKVACLGSDVRAGKERVEARYPFLRSTAAEREALLGPLVEAADAPSPAMSGRRSFEKQASAAL